MGTCCAQGSPIRLWCQEKSSRKPAPNPSSRWAARRARRKWRRRALWQHDSSYGGSEMVNSRFMSTGWRQKCRFEVPLKQRYVRRAQGDDVALAFGKCVELLEKAIQFLLCCHVHFCRAQFESSLSAVSSRQRSRLPTMPCVSTDIWSAVSRSRMLWRLANSLT